MLSDLLWMGFVLVFVICMGCESFSRSVEAKSAAQPLIEEIK